MEWRPPEGGTIVIRGPYDNFRHLRHAGRLPGPPAAVVPQQPKEDDEDTESSSAHLFQSVDAILAALGHSLPLPGFPLDLLSALNGLVEQGEVPPLPAAAASLPTPVPPLPLPTSLFAAPPATPRLPVYAPLEPWPLSPSCLFALIDSFFFVARFNAQIGLVHESTFREAVSAGTVDRCLLCCLLWHSSLFTDHEEIDARARRDLRDMAGRKLERLLSLFWSADISTPRDRERVTRSYALPLIQSLIICLFGMTRLGSLQAARRFLCEVSTNRASEARSIGSGPISPKPPTKSSSSASRIRISHPLSPRYSESYDE